MHYPFENTEWFDHHFPGDFIVEYIGQTRGWFYTLHVLATALFDRPAFLSCISHGIVLGNDGRKASKKLRNYPDPQEMFHTYGSDAVRWSLMASPVLRGGNLVVAEEGIREAVRHVLLPLWNTWYFFSLYAGTCNRGEGYLASPVDMEDPEALAGLEVVDRYVLARTRDLAEAVGELLDAYDLPAASLEIRDHLDLLTNWYVRTTRDRFWEEDTRAFDTLYTALRVLTRVMAPLAPLVAEEVWRGLTGERSVHLTDWPDLPETVADPDPGGAMDGVRFRGVRDARPPGRRAGCGSATAADPARGDRPSPAAGEVPERSSPPRSTSRRSCSSIRPAPASRCARSSPCCPAPSPARSGSSPRSSSARCARASGSAWRRASASPA